MTWDQWLTVGIAVAALGVSAWSVKYAKDSAAASERSAEAAERQAAAAEAALPPPPLPVSWVAQRRGGQTYVLRNTGTEPATGVQIDDLDGFVGVIDDTDTGVVGSGESVGFYVVGVAEGAAVNEVRVTWDGQPQPVVVPLP